MGPSRVNPRTGQILNTAELGRDCGVDAKTVAAWLGVLEACYLIRRVQPHYRNFGKRLMKRSKLYFLDSGLACRLLHIADVNQLMQHSLWGALAETWCIGELLKSRFNRGRRPDLWYWRSNDGLEVDAIVEAGTRLIPVEIKAGSTPSPSLTQGIRKLRELARAYPDATIDPGLVVYGGEEGRPFGDDRFISWRSIDEAPTATA